MANLQYIFDNHVISAGEASYVRLFKCFTPHTAAAPTCLNNTVASVPLPELWRVHNAEVSIVDANGYGRMGQYAGIYALGPRGVGGLTLASGIMGPLIPVKADRPHYVTHGIMWAVYPPVTAGHIVIFRMQYEKVM